MPKASKSSKWKYLAGRAVVGTIIAGVVFLILVAWALNQISIPWMP